MSISNNISLENMTTYHIAACLTGIVHPPVRCIPAKCLVDTLANYVENTNIDLIGFGEDGPEMSSERDLITENNECQFKILIYGNKPRSNHI